MQNIDPKAMIDLLGQPKNLPIYALFFSSFESRVNAFNSAFKSTSVDVIIARFQRLFYLFGRAARNGFDLSYEQLPFLP